MAEAEQANDQQLMPDIGQLKSLVHDAMNEAKKQGASAAEAGVSFGSGLSVTVRLGEVETLEFNRDRGLGVTVYFGQRKGNASTSDWSPAAVRETVQAACSIAKYTSEDSCAGLADASLMATDFPDLDLCHPWDLQPEQGIEIATECEQAARDADSRIINSEGATVYTSHGVAVYGNSHGFVGGYPGTRHTLSCSVIAEQDGAMQRDYWYTLARDARELQDPRAVGRMAGERSVSRLGSRRLSTRQAPVVFVPEMATGLMSSFITAIRGGKLYRKSTFLLDALGKQIFPAFMNISERPLLKRAIGSAPFDNEGVATRERQLVNGGVLEGYVLNSYAARKLGMQTTGNAGGVHNLVVEPGENDIDGLLKNMDTGLLVTEMMGQGVNYVTGDYSRGAAGFWVENGEIQYPVEEITIAGNLRDMFSQIVEVGNDVDMRGNIRTGSILLENMTIAGE